MRAALPGLRRRLLPGALGLALLLTLLPTPVLAQQPPPRQEGPSLSLQGSLGQKAALLLIDGQPHTMKLGQTVAGISLIALEQDRAVVMVAGGRRQTLLMGASPARVGSGNQAAGGRQIVLSGGPGGHFVASGSINGGATRFLVDTGATAVAIGQPEAERLRLNYRAGRQIMTHTANGNVAAFLVKLDSVRIGEVEVRQVDAIVLPGPMSHVLLGNSFLSRFQMRRENELLTLDLRY